jgi:hypothetical protein
MGGLTAVAGMMHVAWLAAFRPWVFDQDPRANRPCLNIVGGLHVTQHGKRNPYRCHFCGARTWDDGFFWNVLCVSAIVSETTFFYPTLHEQ